MGDTTEAFALAAEPTPEVLGQILTTAIGHATHFGLVGDRRKLGAPGLTLLDFLEPYFSSTADVHAWPGTTILGTGTMPQHLYRLNADSLAVVVRAAPPLREWVLPELPEDLHVIRADDSVLFASVTRDGRAWLELTNAEQEAFAGLYEP